MKNNGYGVSSEVEQEVSDGGDNEMHGSTRSAGASEYAPWNE